MADISAADHPIGTVVVHPDDDRMSPAARRRIAVDASEYAGPYEGCRWQRLTGVGIGDGGCDPLHSRDVAGWPVQPLAELAVVLGHPAVDGDLRGRLVDAVLDVLGHGDVATQQEGSERLADVMLAIVRPVLERQAAEIVDHSRAADIDEGTKSELAEENLRLREAVRVAESVIASRDAEIADIYRSANVTMQEVEARIVEKLRGIPLRPDFVRLSESEAVEYADAVALVAGPIVEGLHAELADLRASREAWAIEAVDLDAELAGRPTVDAYEKACQALELRRVALVKALGLPATASFYDAVDQVARLARERDDVRVDLASERAVYADSPDDRLWHAADQTWWRRAEDGRLVRGEAPLEVERLTRDRDEAQQRVRLLETVASIEHGQEVYPGTPAFKVMMELEELRSRPAIPADAEKQLNYLLVRACNAEPLEFQPLAEARKLLAAWSVPASGSGIKPSWFGRTCSGCGSHVAAREPEGVGDVLCTQCHPGDLPLTIGSDTTADGPKRQWTDSTGIVWQEAQPGFVHVVSPMTGQPHMFGEPVELEKVEAKFGPLTAAVPTPDTDTTEGGQK